ncbi:hypothetical protein QNA08_16795 [Chelatococcus sp. SYSU_G07232]|uniref:DUF493 domain-containing protein n=1 Tax=Chelatococcus albus TaxID=3047466 RepID=A0ABT7AKK0_9HYPH|nr:hypothetical protein [Chelatococcus sp. SYSU_G07232]MDJ1159878.1 hypothetical protein [Chelatococcus sp. SYSU_G07232]
MTRCDRRARRVRRRGLEHSRSSPVVPCMNGPADSPIRPKLVVRDGAGEIVIGTLEEALAFIARHELAVRSANRDGTIFRLQAATSAEEKIAANEAFRGWVEAAGLLIRAE